MVGVGGSGRVNRRRLMPASATPVVSSQSGPRRGGVAGWPASLIAAFGVPFDLPPLASETAALASALLLSLLAREYSPLKARGRSTFAIIATGGAERGPASPRMRRV